MKIQKLIGSVLCLLPLAGFAQKPFTITGHIGKLNAPAMAYLSYMQGSNMLEDSSMLKNGVFTFKGMVDEPCIARLYLSHDGDNPQRIKQPDFMTVLLDGNTTLTSKDSLGTAVIKGTRLNLDYIAIEKQKAISSNKIVKLWNDYHALPASQQDAKAFGDAYGKAMADDRTTKQTLDITYAKQHPGSQLSPMLLIWYANSMPLDTLETIYNAFSAPVKENSAAKVIAKKIYSRKSIEIGGLAPDFTIPDTAGTPVSLASFRGKYVLVDFWATWCKPCRAENPNVVKAFHAYKDKNFTVLSVSIDDSPAKEKWLKAITDDHINGWTNVSELKGRASQISNLYHLESIPQNVLVDPQGKIIAKNLRGEALQEKLATVLH